MTSFAGQRIVITGGSSGIGKELARQWLASGAHVTIVADGAAGLEAAQRELSTGTAAIETAVCDVADASGVEVMARRYVERYGAPHVVVNNAGTTRSAGRSRNGRRKSTAWIR
jgi:NAD(P)-dependent dehydrogenase (short-subunit alcohol dehydrogenase family)